MNDILMRCDSAPIVLETLKEDVKNCYALSLDKRIETIVDLTENIEHLMGLTSDKPYRDNRVREVRQAALQLKIDPHLSAPFSSSVDEYIGILNEKKSILESIYECCDDFCLTMQKGLEHLDKTFASNPSARSSFVRTYKKKKGTFFRKDKHRRNRLPSSALNILWDFVRTHKNNPYPTNQQKEHLVRQTNLTMTQIRNWFTNTRKRKLGQTPESDEDFSIGSEGDCCSYSSSLSEEIHHHSRKKKCSWEDPTLYAVPSTEVLMSESTLKKEPGEFVSTYQSQVLIEPMDTTETINVSQEPVDCSVPAPMGLTVDTSIQPKQDFCFNNPSPHPVNGTWIQYDGNTPHLFRGLSISSAKGTPRSCLSLRCSPRGNHNSVFDEFNESRCDDCFFSSLFQDSNQDIEFFINNEMVPHCKKEPADSNVMHHLLSDCIV